MRSTQALALEAILEKGLANAKKPGGLLTGLGARLSVASDLPRRGQPRERLATGLDSLDGLLPGGLPRGKLVELSGRRSSGRFSIALSALASVTSTGEPAALVDPGEHLDPQGAAASGVDLELLLWVRPRRVKESLAAAEMLLAAGFPLVVADFGLSARGARFVPDAAWLRLARAVEAQGSSLLLLTPYRMSGIAANAVLTAGASHSLWQGAGGTPRLLTGLTSRLTLQKNARLTPGDASELRLSLFPPLPHRARPLLSLRSEAPPPVILRSEAPPPVILRSEATKDLLPSPSPQSQITNHKSLQLAHCATRVMPGNPSKPESKLMIRETPCRSMTAR